MFVINKFIIKTFLTSNSCFRFKFESSIHNIALLVNICCLKLKLLNDGFVSCKRSFSFNKMDWSYLNFLWIIVMFLISCLDIMTAPIHFRWYISEQVCYISPNLFWWRNKIIYISDGLKLSKLWASFNFWVNYSFNIHPFMLIFVHTVLISVLIAPMKSDKSKYCKCINTKISMEYSVLKC